MNGVRSWLATPTRSIPRWVLGHLVLVVAATGAGAYAGAIGEPDILFADFDGVTIDGPLRFLTDLWSSKNLAYLSAFAITVALGSRAGLAAILAMKFVNDSLDQLLFSPLHLDDASVATIAPSWLVMTLPMAFGAAVLSRNAGVHASDRPGVQETR